MKKSTIILALTVLSPLVMFAQPMENSQVPAIEKDNINPVKENEIGYADPPPINLISGVQYPLSKKEKKGMRLANEWKDRNDFPARGDDGSVVFIYGATLPSVVCAPLYGCILKLQPGEVVLSNDVGDKVRWRVTPTIYGKADDETTAIVIKPTDSGLKTDLVVATDRRLYIVKLVSRVNDWMPLVSFSYPEEINARWAAYHAEKKKKHEETIIPTTGQNIAHLDFGFIVSGDSPGWRPTRVYTDGLKTYIQFPPSIKSIEIPALVVVGVNKKEQLVNYRMIGNSYVVDQVINTAALISGVGNNQVKVYIKRDRRAA